MAKKRTIAAEDGASAAPAVEAIDQRRQAWQIAADCEPQLEEDIREIDRQLAALLDPDKGEKVQAAKAFAHREAALRDERAALFESLVQARNCKVKLGGQ